MQDSGIQSTVPTRSTVRSTAATSSHSRRILIVDDDESATWILGKLLCKLGDHQIQEAHDGAEALRPVDEIRPEIVLLDIGLPGMNGFEVGRAIRAEPANDDVLLVALTGHDQNEDKVRSQQAGFDEHLVKPPSLEQMKAVLSHPKIATSV